MHPNIAWHILTTRDCDPIFVDFANRLVPKYGFATTDNFCIVLRNISAALHLIMLHDKSAFMLMTQLFFADKDDVCSIILIRAPILRIFTAHILFTLLWDRSAPLNFVTFCHVAAPFSHERIPFLTTVRMGISVGI